MEQYPRYRLTLKGDETGTSHATLTEVREALESAEIDTADEYEITDTVTGAVYDVAIATRFEFTPREAQS